MQAAPEAHWPVPLPEQPVRQAFPPHTKGLQGLEEPAVQLPWPSQNAAVVLLLVVVLQVAPAHMTPLPGIEQLVCAPLQVP